jgi:hypothetical protein
MKQCVSYIKKGDEQNAEVSLSHRGGYEEFCILG